MTKQTVAPILSNVNPHLDLIAADDPLDLIQLEKCNQLECEKAECSSIGCRKFSLSNFNNFKYYFKQRLIYLTLQTVDYKSHFKKPCFYCSSCFHGSSYEDGHFNIQKILEDGPKCHTCQKHYTIERLFYHNCNICKASFQNCQSLVQHRSSEHNSKKPNQCPVCYVSLSYRIGDHVLKHTLPHICPYCNKRYAINKTLKLHILSHTGEKPFSCVYCPRKYKTKANLENHLFQHIGEKNYKCDLCDRTFGKQYSLNKHKSYHMAKLFRCEYCQKQYKSKQNLEYHLFEHTGGKQFKCDSCDKSFAKLHLLNRHKTIHMEKSFQCPNCLNFYKTLCNLRSHIRKVHKYNPDIKLDTNK